MSDSVRSVEDTEYDKLCTDCQHDLDLGLPQYHAMVVFKGDFKTERCGRCGDRLR